MKGPQLMSQLMMRLLLSQCPHLMKGPRLMPQLMRRPLLMRRLVLMRVHYLLLKILAMSTFAYLYHSL